MADQWGQNGGAASSLSQGSRDRAEALYPAYPAVLSSRGVKCDRGGDLPAAAERLLESRSLLQLALEQLDLVGQRGIVADQVFDLANRVQHGGVVAAPEAAADLRERP